MDRSVVRIGDLARILCVEDHVIRFWEKEFKIKGQRSPGGQRYYTDEDVELFQRIKHLLYEQHFTIAGARKLLRKKQHHSSDRYATLIHIRQQLQRIIESL